MATNKKDFFINYTGNDEQWATWIAGTLENNQYKENNGSK
ncbi:MAG: toll/interleukin-1 receptor domain-containing protein [Tannerella sp.]|jgi:hypothetical protein|nr:toll/interleukin-1 receptor domain-containing protein [Tannerella sp.]